MAQTLATCSFVVNLQLDSLTMIIKLDWNVADELIDEDQDDEDDDMSDLLLIEGSENSCVSDNEF